MKFFSWWIAPAIVLFVFSSLAVAHPGHGNPSVAHYVVEPVHQFQVATVTITIMVSVGLIALSVVRKRISR